MSFIGNLLWIIFGGFLIFLEYLIGGVVLCLTVVGIPFGIQLFKLSLLGLVPFGKRIEYRESSLGCLSLIMNIIWIIIGGIPIVLTHLLFGFFFAITIIGLPFAIQHLKLSQLAFSPFGKKVV